MKIYLDTIGCRLNQAEIERYARQFHAAGHILVATPEQADLAVVNTCSVTAAAASDSRQKIRQAGRAGVKDIVVTGCWSTLKRSGSSRFTWRQPPGNKCRQGSPGSQPPADPGRGV